MNRKGQTLILFVLMIPVLLILAALVIDIGLMTNEKIKSSNVTAMILKEEYENRNQRDIEKRIKSSYEKNKIETENLDIKASNDYLWIQNEYNIDSIFGKLIGIKNYRIKINKKIQKEKDKWIIE